LRIVSSVFLIEIFDLEGKRAVIRERIMLLNHFRKCVQNSEVEGHVWVELKLVTNHLRKMIYYWIYYSQTFTTGTSNNLLTVI